MNRIFIFIFFISGFITHSQSIIGKWKTYDILTSSKEESIVEISTQNDSLYVKIVKIIPREHQNDLCTKCDGENKNKPIVGLTILKGATLQGNIWKGAKILNAKSGFYYGCHISIKDDKRLRIRGFIGYPFFGKTVYWHKVERYY